MTILEQNEWTNVAAVLHSGVCYGVSLPLSDFAGEEEMQRKNFNGYHWSGN
jgi:hypothetical protein